MLRTPVIGTLPKVLMRNVRPHPTPVIGGVQVKSVKEMMKKSELSDNELDAMVELAGIAPESDPAWASIHVELLKSSCGYFASEFIRGPKKAPYNGKFLLGRHHLEWDELIMKHRRLNILAARDHGKCTSAYSFLVDSNGARVHIKDWVGGEVLAYDRESYQLVSAFAHGAQFMGHRRCIKVTTRTGRTETVTPNHRFMLVDGEVFAEDLRLGMRIGVPKYLPVEGTKPLMSGEAWLIAFLNGAGGLTDSTSILLSKSDSEVVDYARFVAKQLGGELADWSVSNKYGFTGLLDWARSIGIHGNKSRDRKIPDCIFTSPNSDVAEYIAGTIDADCHINSHGKGSVEFCSASEELLRGIQHLLTRLGVVAVLRENTHKDNPHQSWALSVRGQPICVLASKVFPKGKRGRLLVDLAEKQPQNDEEDSVDLLPNVIYEWLNHSKDWFRQRGFLGYDRVYDLTRSKALKLAKAEGNERLERLANAPILWDAVARIEDAGEHDTYSFTVPNYETYVGQDVINHNSHFFTMAYPIWKAGYNHPGSHGIIFSATQPQAEEFLGKIKAELLDNPKLAHLVPYTGSRFWSAKKLTLRNGSIIRAAGFGVKVRGGHPDYCVCDDVLNDDDIYSETIRRRNIDYFLSAIAGMVHVEDQLIVVGSPLHQADLYAVLSDRDRVVSLAGEVDEKALSGYLYECRTYPAKDPKTGELLFPERYDERALQLKRIELKSEARFAREYLCQCMSDEASLFPSKLFEGDIRLPYVLGMPSDYWDQRNCSRYTGVDIAMSAETSGDYFVIFTVAVDAEGTRYIANIRRGKGWSFTRQIDEIKEEYYLMRPEVIHIEANQMQRVWTDEIARTTDLPVRKFFTTGVGGRQPPQPWKKGATSVASNKHHLDRGIPGLRMTLEHRKWRIPRGDARSIELTDIWIGEMGAIGWVDGKVQSVAAHDDLVFSCWMADTAIRLGNPRFEWLEADSTKSESLLTAPAPEKPQDFSAASLDAERYALAAIQEGRQIECEQDQYFSRIRSALRTYAEQAVDSSNHQRAAWALQEAKRLDSLFNFRAYDAEVSDVAKRNGEGYRGWQPTENAPTLDDLDKFR